MSVRIDNRASACTAKETTRFAINGALVSVGGGKNPDAFAVATDGRTLAVIPLDASEHKGPGFSGIAPREALKVGNKIGMLDHTPGEKGKPGRFTTATYTAKRTGLVPAGMITPADGAEGVEGTFPPFADVFPQSGDYAAITLNPELLERVMLAVDAQDEGARGVTILVPIMPNAVQVGPSMTVRGGTNKPAIVLGQTDKGGAGVIMPINKLDPDAIGQDVARALWMVQRAAELSKDHASPSKITRPGVVAATEPPAAPVVSDKPVKLAKRAAPKPAATPEPTPEPVAAVVEPVAVSVEPTPAPEPVVHAAGRQTPPKGQATHKAGGWEVKTGASKRGRQWVALIPAERMEPDAYRTTLERVKLAGGWSKDHGFAVWAEDRAKLAELIGA